MRSSGDDGRAMEYGGATGGFGRIVTKQGTNVFRPGGTFRPLFFDGGTINSGTDSNDTTTSGRSSTSRPDRQDKLFFALFHEYVDWGCPSTS
jgi:hypothetical protein